MPCCPPPLPPPQETGILELPEGPCCATLATLFWQLPLGAPPADAAERLRPARHLREVYLGGELGKEEAEALAAALFCTLPELQRVAAPRLGWARARHGGE